MSLKVFTFTNLELPGFWEGGGQKYHFEVMVKVVNVTEKFTFIISYLFLSLFIKDLSGSVHTFDSLCIMSVVSAGFRSTRIARNIKCRLLLHPNTITPTLECSIISTVVTSNKPRVA